jgi:hypothetical protein
VCDGAAACILIVVIWLALTGTVPLCLPPTWRATSSGEEERQQNALLVTKHLAEYERLQTLYKEAIVEQHRRTVEELADERRQLLGPNGSAKLLLQTESDALVASRNITDGLRRTKQVLAEVGILCCCLASGVVHFFLTTLQ